MAGIGDDQDTCTWRKRRGNSIANEQQDSLVPTVIHRGDNNSTLANLSWLFISVVPDSDAISAPWHFLSMA